MVSIKLAMMFCILRDVDQKFHEKSFQTIDNNWSSFLKIYINLLISACVTICKGRVADSRIMTFAVDSENTKGGRRWSFTRTVSSDAVLREVSTISVPSFPRGLESLGGWLNSTPLYSSLPRELRWIRARRDAISDCFFFFFFLYNGGY